MEENVWSHFGKWWAAGLIGQTLVARNRATA